MSLSTELVIYQGALQSLEGVQINGLYDLAHQLSKDLFPDNLNNHLKFIIFFDSLMDILVTPSHKVK